MRRSGRKTGQSTMQAARTFSAKLERAGGWDRMSRARQLDAIAKARSFVLVADAHRAAHYRRRLCSAGSICGLGTSARTFCPDAHTWFVDACARVDVRPADIALQWNALAKVTAVTGVRPEQVGAEEFEHGSHGGHRRLPCPRETRVRPQHGRDLPPAPAHPVPRRPARQLTVDHRVARRCRSPAGPWSHPGSPTTPAATSPRSS